MKISGQAHRFTYTTMRAVEKKYFDNISWTLQPIQDVEDVMRREFHLPRHWFYQGFDMDTETVIFAPFWSIPWKEWRRRIPVLERIHQRKIAKRNIKMNENKAKRFHER